MDSNQIQKISSEIYRRFPEVKGVRPDVLAQGKKNHLLIFRTKTTTSDGRSIMRTVRVVVDENGQMTKVTTSR
jgi:hypothetical protein